jgi:hypothetical protein
MIIVFPSHKGDKEGRTALPKHFYANTAEPSKCPILSFAVYILTRDYERESSKMTIFAIGSTYAPLLPFFLQVCGTLRPYFCSRVEIRCRRLA